MPLRIEILQGHLALYHRHHIEIMDMETMRYASTLSPLPFHRRELILIAWIAP